MISGSVVLTVKIAVPNVPNDTPDEATTIDICLRLLDYLGQPRDGDSTIRDPGVVIIVLPRGVNQLPRQSL